MEEQKFSFTGSYQKAKEYLDTQIEILKLKAISKSSRIVGVVVLDVSKVVIVLIIFFRWSVALGCRLGELMNSCYLEFPATGRIFIVILIIIRAIKPKPEAKLMEVPIKKNLGKW